MLFIGVRVNIGGTIQNNDAILGFDGYGEMRV